MTFENCEFDSISNWDIEKLFLNESVYPELSFRDTIEKPGGISERFNSFRVR